MLGKARECENERESATTLDSREFARKKRHYDAEALTASLVPQVVVGLFIANHGTPTR
jgi:hypothetical protein